MADVSYGKNITAQEGRMSEKLLTGYTTYDILKEYDLFHQNIAQSRYFTVTIDKLKYAGKPITFKLSKPSLNEYPPGTSLDKIHVFNDFFPVKNISVNFIII